MGEKTHLSIRLDSKLHDQLQHIAKYDGRSMSGQILHLIQQCIRGFEKEHAPIDPEGSK